MRYWVSVSVMRRKCSSTGADPRFREHHASAKTVTALAHVEEQRREQLHHLGVQFELESDSLQRNITGTKKSLKHLLSAGVAGRPHRPALMPAGNCVSRPAQILREIHFHLHRGLERHWVQVRAEFRQQTKAVVPSSTTRFPKVLFQTF